MAAIAQVLDGKKLSLEIQQQLKNRVHERTLNRSRAPGLCIILVGNDPASKTYVRKKEEMCQKIGYNFYLNHVSDEITQNAVIEKIRKANSDDTIDGILVQLPLPAHFDAELVLSYIDPRKDADGITPYNMGRLALRNPAVTRPCTPLGIIRLLDHYDIPIKGKHAVVVGASNIVGRPMALELLLKGATVTTCHRFTKNLEDLVCQAEILVVAVGKHNIIHETWIRRGSVVIDVGINFIEFNGTRKMIGDLDFESVKYRAEYLSPVPGGVGPMTVATLMQNVYNLCELHTAKEEEMEMLL